jgi:hypothetical protein
VGGCAIRHVCGTWHDRDEGQTPGGFGGFAALRIEGLERGLAIHGPKVIAHLHQAGVVGKGCPRHSGGCFGDGINRLWDQGHHAVSCIETRCLLPDDGHRISVCKGQDADGTAAP